MRGLRGGTFFRATFYCLFGRFGKLTHLVNLKKWGGSSPLCPPLYATPDAKYAQMSHYFTCKFKDELFQTNTWGHLCLISKIIINFYSTLQKSDMKQFLKTSRVISLLLSRKKCK